MTPEEKAIPGELLIRLFFTLLLAALWTAVPFVLIYRFWHRLFSRQIAKDFAWCASFVALCGMLVLLNGCNTTERDHLACLDYGFEAGTQEYAGCRMQLAEHRKTRAIGAWSAMTY